MSVKEYFKAKKDKILSSKKGKIGLAIGVVVILCMGIIISKKVGNSEDMEMMEDLVETYSIPENEKIFMNGEIKPKESKAINLDSGYDVTKVSVSNGQYVTKGQTLFTAQDQEALNQIVELETQLNTTEDVDAIKNEIKKLKNKAYKTVYSPISGNVYLEEESMATESIPAYMTVESTDYYMKGKVSEQDLPKIKENMEVDIYIFATEEDMKGRISSISARPSNLQENQDMTVNSSLSYYDVTVDFNSQEGLVNGYHVQASVEIDNINSKIPVSCVLREEDDEAFVYKVIDNKLVKQPVEIKNENEDFIVLESGLVQNDIIVKFPTEDMKEGDDINSDNAK